MVSTDDSVTNFSQLEKKVREPWRFNLCRVGLRPESRKDFPVRAYVQQVRQSAPNHIQLVQSAHAFWERGYEVVPFQYEEIEQGGLDEYLLRQPNEMVLRGGVGTVLKALERAGRPRPPNLDLPLSLEPWFGRRVWHSTLEEVRNQIANESSQPLHVKPRLHHKLFKGQVFGVFRDLIPTAGIPGDTPVLVQDCVDLVSEWRATILRDRVLCIGHYSGDPLVFPNVESVKAAIGAFDNRPIGFSMDWGITRSGQTLLVEVNDGFSLGNYGVRGLAFSALIEARWRELMGLSDNGVGDQYA